MIQKIQVDFDLTLTMSTKLNIDTKYTSLNLTMFIIFCTHIFEIFDHF